MFSLRQVPRTFPLDRKTKKANLAVVYISYEAFKKGIGSFKAFHMKRR
jgi:hypothetical protein